MQLNEIRKEDDLYLIGPFWLIGESVDNILNGNFIILSERFLADFEGNVIHRVPKAQFTHKGTWEMKYKNFYGVDYNYFPRGRISQKEGKAYLNIPDSINNPLITERLKKEFDIKKDFDMIKNTDPTTGNHYSFQLK